jgi:hypothetical protein
MGMSLTKPALAALVYYKTGAGTKPGYEMLRALIEQGYLTPAGALSVKGEEELQKAIEKG